MLAAWLIDNTVSAEELDVLHELQVTQECLLVTDCSQQLDLVIALRLGTEIEHLCEQKEELFREHVALQEGWPCEAATMQYDSDFRALQDLVADLGDCQSDGTASGQSRKCGAHCLQRRGRWQTSR